MSPYLKTFNAAAQKLTNFDAVYPGKGLYLLRHEVVPHIEGSPLSRKEQKELVDAAVGIHQNLIAHDAVFWNDWRCGNFASLEDMLTNARTELESHVPKKNPDGEFFEGMIADRIRIRVGHADGLANISRGFQDPQP